MTAFIVDNAVAVTFRIAPIATASQRSQNGFSKHLFAFACLNYHLLQLGDASTFK